MIIKSLSLLLLISSVLYPQGFTQNISVDTSIQMLENTPNYVGSQGLTAHRRIEMQIDHKTFNLKRDLYMVFRYRTEQYIPFWLELIEKNPLNDLIKIWFINALEQMENPAFLQYIAPYTNSSNDIIRECAINAYGFFDIPDSISILQKILLKETNGFIRETVKSSITAIKSGGYKNKVEYLPQYYNEPPKKIKFFYNVDVMSSELYHYKTVDTSLRKYDVSTFLVYPTQQFFNRIKYAPNAGTFANFHGAIAHVGYDGAWFFEGLPVHSISNGIVKGTMHDLSWGHLVAVESCLPCKDTITVIYGHLSRYLSVSAGDSVYCGQRIGQIGNSVSYENGGYWAHTHVGIIKKPFSKAILVGYDYDTTGYENPITLIQNYQSK